GVQERALVAALAAGWGMRVARLAYIPEGFGSYHWRAEDTEGRRHFVTVDDLDKKGWLGDDRESTFRGLRCAFDTAVALRCEGGLDFVVAPVPAVDGTSVVRLGSRHSVAVFPFLCPEPRRFERDQGPDERAELVRLLV